MSIYIYTCIYKNIYVLLARCYHVLSVIFISSPSLNVLWLTDQMMMMMMMMMMTTMMPATKLIMNQILPIIPFSRFSASCVTCYFWRLNTNRSSSILHSPGSSKLSRLSTIRWTPRNSKVKTKAKAKEHKMKFTAAAASIG